MTDDAMNLLMQERYSIDEIAEKMHVSKRTVARWRQQLGLSHPNALSEEQLRTVELLLEDDCPIAEIARTIGCSPEALHKRYRNRPKPRYQPFSRRQREIAKSLGLELIQ